MYAFQLIVHYSAWGVAAAVCHYWFDFFFF